MVTVITSDKPTREQQKIRVSTSEFAKNALLLCKSVTVPTFDIKDALVDVKCTFVQISKNNIYILLIYDCHTHHTFLLTFGLPQGSFPSRVYFCNMDSLCRCRK